MNRRGFFRAALGAAALPMSSGLLPAALPPAKAASRTVTVHLVGDFSREQVRDLMDRIVAEQRNGSKVVLA